MDFKYHEVVEEVGASEVKIVAALVLGILNN